MITEAEQRRARREQSKATRREAADHRWRLRTAARAPIAADGEPGWLDGPRGIVRGFAILLGAALLGGGYALLVNAIDPPAVIGPQA